MKKSRALIDRNPMAIDKDLANVFGLDLAALLQHIHFSITEKESNPRKYFSSYKNGFFWYYDSKKSISEQMPFLGSPRTIQRLISKGQEMLVLIVEEFNSLPGDNTNWFRIDHPKLDEIMQEYYSKKYPEMAEFYAQYDQEQDTPPRQIGSTPKTNWLDPQDKLARPPRQIGSTNTIDFSETSHRKDLNTPYIPPTGETSDLVKADPVYVRSEDFREAAGQVIDDYSDAFKALAQTTDPKTPSPSSAAPPSPAGFDEFWQQYPAKVAKPAALRAWRKLKPGQDLQATIQHDIAKRKASDPKWEQGFIPNPATYINQARWEDQPVNVEKKPAVDAARRITGQNQSDEEVNQIFEASKKRWEAKQAAMAQDGQNFSEYEGVTIDAFAV